MSFNSGRCFQRFLSLLVDVFGFLLVLGATTRIFSLVSLAIPQLVNPPQWREVLTLFVIQEYVQSQERESQKKLSSNECLQKSSQDENSMSKEQDK